MSHARRLYCLLLCLSAAAGWALGIVLLPVVMWAAMELCLTLGDRLGGQVQ